MGRITVTTQLSLDGVVQSPGAPEEDPSGGFDRGGWVAPHVDDDMLRIIAEDFGRAGAFLLGRRTYEIFAAHWPLVTDRQDPIATALNTLPKHVVSGTLGTPGWAGTEVVRGDLVTEVTRLRDTTDGELQVHGSITLVRALLEADLVDEYRLWTFPVVVGAGRRLFAEGLRSRTVRLVDTASTGAGAIRARYQPVGPARFGSLALGG
ncbi:dihydrofolate reductase family protein [Actinoalloteichus caeruleus]|uniref:dihydrofolate reductase family protein n=1 Tax=Actinoalloteichus cyanogriseus TaxID=2893586 RepID=UPI0004AB7F17|nr:dihydrofolate reductase family protein [Actinoalloteichus caeruleus]